jgi:AraC-like DNA-binding protein
VQLSKVIVDRNLAVAWVNQNGQFGGLDFSLMNRRSVAIYRAAMFESRALAVSGFGMQAIRSQVVERTLASYAVVLVESGAGTLTTRASGVHRVVGPCLFFLVPGVAHSYGPDAGTEWHERWALFEGALAGEFERSELIRRGEPLVPLGDVTEMVRLFSTLHSEMLDHAPLSRAACAATLHRLVVRGAMQRPVVEGASAGAIGALRDRALESVDLAALAQEFGLSPATLRRHCLEAYGVPPKVLQMRLRLDRAKELLAVTSDTVEAIAQAVGFEDSFYFSRIFLKYEACAPTVFRRMNRRS